MQLEEINLSDFRAEDVGWVIQRHAEHYTTSQGFDDTFGQFVADIVAAFLRDHDPTCEKGWIARHGETRVGCIFCVRQDEVTAKLRMFLIEPAARGIGLGHRLISSCIAFAQGAGYERMALWTHESHVIACALYEKHGFQLDDSTPVHSFGVDLVEQTWSRDLGGA